MSGISNKEDQEAGASTQTGSEDQCPLDMPNIPPVGETEHQIGNCFCHMCTCGLHQCPGEPHQFSSTSLQYRSSYQLNFRKYSNTSVALHKREYEFTPNHNSLESLTTHRRDFLPHSVLPEPSCKPSSSQYNWKFGYRTSYQSDFPNWRAEKTEFIKRIKDCYRGNEVPMNCTSTYGSEFVAKKVELSQAKGVAEEMLRKTHDSFGIVSKGKDWLGQSHNKWTYQPPRTPQIPSLVRIKSSSNLAPIDVQKPLKSTYMRDFKPTQVSLFYRKRRMPYLTSR